MVKSATVLLLSFLFATSLCAQTVDLELKNPQQKKRTVEAGYSFNVLLTVTNSSDDTRRFSIRLREDNSNVKLIADYTSIIIQAQSTVTKIVGIIVSTGLKSGDHDIPFEITEEGQTTPFALFTIPIDVQPKIDFSFEKMDGDPYVFAGDSARAHFILTNKSNQDININITRMYLQTVKQGKLHLKKDTSVIISMAIKTNKDITSFSKQSMSIKVQLVEKTDAEKTLYHNFDVFPSVKQQFDRFTRYPITISGIGVSSNRRGPREYATMFEITGKEYLDEVKSQLLELHMRGPNRAGNPLLGQNDHYYLGYTSKYLNVSLGDVNFSLSDLTESARSGRGIKSSININNLNICGFYNKPRYYPAISHVYATSSTITFNSDNQISLGVIGKADTLNNTVYLTSLYGNIKPFSWLSTRYEVSAGQVEKGFSTAYKGSMIMRFGRISTSATYLHADTDFPGYVTNSTRISIGFNASFKRIGINANYDYNDTYKALDTLFANDPFNENLTVTNNIKLGKKTSLTIGYLKNNASDKSPLQKFNYLRESARLTLNTQLGDFTSSFGSDVGRMKNYLGTSDNISNFINGNGYIGYRFRNIFSTSIHGTYQGGKQQNVTGFERFYYGGSVGIEPASKYSFYLSYNSNYEFQDYTRDRSLLTLQSTVQFLEKHQIKFGINYNLIKNTLNTKELNIQFNYIYKLGIPIGKKKDVGSLTGRLISKEKNTSVENIRLNLDGILTITDKNGNYRFPALKVGQYELGMLESNLGLNTITEEPGPFKVDIKPSQTTHLDIVLTKSAKVSGKLVVLEDENVNQKGYIPVKEKIDRVVVEANNGKEIFRVLTDVDGGFVFADLRPGDWKFKVYPNGIPQGYQLIKSEINITLAPGQQEEVEFTVQKKARQIRFQKSF